MPQPAIKVDQIQIEPGTTTYGSRLIDRNTADGGLRFTDPNVVASLLSLVGLRNVSGIFLVGRAGDGAPYTTIQDALDAIPDTSDPDAPSLVVVGPGVYSESLTIQKDGVLIVGLGRPKITASTGATVTISDDAASTPESVVLRNLVIENTGIGEECILISGAGTYATGTATVSAVPLTAGDTIVIAGNTLTAVAGTRTSGSDDFSLDGVTVAALAAEIEAAINDTANSFATDVVAEAAAGVVTLTAVAAGVAGNVITLTETGANLTVSGATLTGGSAAGSPVGAVGIHILDCDLIATGSGGYQVRADTVNYIRVEGGNWRGSATNSVSEIIQCASFRLHGVEWVNDLDLSYNDGNDQPQVTTSEYRVSHCGRGRNTLSNLTGTGSLTLLHSELGDVTQGGDLTLDVSHCRIGDITVDDTTAATLTETNRGTAAGAGTLSESVLVGSVSFVASSSESVVFGVGQPDTTYGVFVSASVPGSISSKTTTGFDIDLPAGPVTETVFYSVMRQM